MRSSMMLRGCAALAYRLSGDLLDHLCVVHLIGALRVMVAFESAKVAYVILFGNHDDSQPPLDVYRQLYAAAGHEPLDQAGRDKPPAAALRLASRLSIPSCWMNCWPACAGLGHRTCARRRGGDVAHDNVILADRGIAEPHKPGQLVGSAQTSARPR
jgi:hypothetical protein